MLAALALTDSNLNRSGVRYDALGMVVATAGMGKLLPDGTDEGDHLDTSTAEPPPATTPRAPRIRPVGLRDVGGRPGARPGPAAPVWVHTQARVRHKDPATPWIESYAYSDGFGPRRAHEGPGRAGPAPAAGRNGNLVRDADGTLVFAPTDNRWVGSGRVVYDNKGNPVKAYEPFFDSSPVYDDESDLVDWGVTAITRYDPLSRAIRVDNPDGSYRTVEFDAWHTSTRTRTTPSWKALGTRRARRRRSAQPSRRGAQGGGRTPARRPQRSRHARPDVPQRRRQRRRRPVRDPADLDIEGLRSPTPTRSAGSSSTRTTT